MKLKNLRCSTGIQAESIKKVLFICHEDMSRHNGGVVQVVELAKALKDIGYQVEISAPKIGKYQEITSAKIDYVPIINLSFLRPFSYIITSFFYYLYRLKRFKPSITLFFSISFAPHIVLISNLFGIPVINFINGIVNEELKVQGLSNPVISLIKFLHQVCIKFSTSIITVTESVKQDIHKSNNYPLESIKIIKNGVNIKKFYPMDKNYARKKIGHESQGFFIGFVGSLFKWHGMEDLVKCSPLVLRELPNTKFIIVGEGSEKTILINMARELNVLDSFIFTGEVPNSIVPLYINAFDLCIVFFKKIRENTGDSMKMYEYLACGKPVIASNVEGYGDFVEKINAGISVDSSNIQMVADKILQLLRDEKLRRKMGLNGRQVVKLDHTWINRARLIEFIIESVRKI